MAEQATNPRCILVVDGDVLVRHAIADYLRTCGYVVVEASSTDEAVTVLSDESVNVNAVLCDADAPGSQNAFQFRAWAADHRKHVRLALAGNIKAAARKAAELCDDGPHLARPYDPQAVIEYIRRLLGSATP